MRFGRLPWRIGCEAEQVIFLGPALAFPVCVMGVESVSVARENFPKPPDDSTHLSPTDVNHGLGERQVTPGRRVEVPALDHIQASGHALASGRRVVG